MSPVTKIGIFITGTASIGGFVREGIFSSVAKDAADLAGRCLATNTTDVCKSLTSTMVSYQYGALGVCFGSIIVIGAAWFTTSMCAKRKVTVLV